MSRTKNKVEISEIVRLKKAVEQSYGSHILLHTDCQILANEIFHKNGTRISQQTLRRFFGLIKNKSSISISTLNILTQYAGHRDWEDFSHGNKKIKKNEPSLTNLEIDFLKAFYGSNIEPSKDINFYQASFSMALKILKSEYSEFLLKTLAANKNAQTFFYEMFPCIDQAGEKYFLGITEYLKHKKTKEAQMFGHSFLFLRSFLLEDQNDINREFLFLSKMKIDYSIHPLPTARLIGTHFLYHSIAKHKKNYKEWVSLSVNMCLKNYNEDNPYSFYFPGYHFIIVDYLILVEEYHKAAEVIEMQEQLLLKFHPLYASHINCLEVAKLQKAIVSAFTGKEKRSREMVADIKPELFWYFEKKFNTIRLLLLSLHLLNPKYNRKKLRLIMQTQMLIRETGFTYFNRSLTKYL